MAWVYILRCSDGTFYTGSTLDLDARLWQHNFGAKGEGANYTFKRRPVELVFAQYYEDVEDAFVVEKQVQGWSRAKKLALIEGRFTDLPGLSRNAALRRAQGPRKSSGTAPVSGTAAASVRELVEGPLAPVSVPEPVEGPPPN